MTYTTLDGSWSEFCLIAICAQSGTDTAYHAITETIDIDVGEKGFDVVPTLSGARLIKFTPMEPITITFEAYPIRAGTDSGTTGKGFFDLLHTVDASQPVSISVDKLRTPYRISILWTSSSAATSGHHGAVDGHAFRIVAADGYFISYKESMTDGIKKATVVFKVAPFDSAGAANFKIESIEGSGTLDGLAAYTSSNKW